MLLQLIFFQLKLHNSFLVDFVSVKLCNKLFLLLFFGLNNWKLNLLTLSSYTIRSVSNFFFQVQLILVFNGLICSWRLAGFTFCCGLYSNSCKKNCKDRNDRCRAYGKTISLFSHWSVGLDWDFPCIICVCTSVPNNIGDKCTNMPSFPTCINGVRLHGWFWVKLHIPNFSKS